MNNHFLKLCLFLLFLANPCLAGYFQRIVISPEGTPYLSMSTKEGGHNIIRYNLQKKTLGVYYPTPNPENCHINYSSLDPTGKKLAYFGYCKLANAIPSETSSQGFYNLTIVDIKNKKEVITLKNGGGFFSFSPKGDAIVYAERIPEGIPIPPDYHGGVWLYNFYTKSKKMILPASVVAKDLNWSGHDGNIYFQTYPLILRYNVARGKIEEVSYKGIYFSYDGKYYVATPSTVNAQIYRTADNKEMVEWEDKITNMNKQKYYMIKFLAWSKKLNALIVCGGGSNNLVLDINQGKVIAEFSGDFIGTNAEGTLVAIHPPGKNNRDKVEILNLLDLVNKFGSPK